MATAISLYPGDAPARPEPPDCEEAAECGWFETLNTADRVCANRDSMFCHKRLKEVFALHDQGRRRSG